MRPTGNQRSHVAKIMMKMRQTQKVGMEYMIMPVLVVATSKRLLRRQPAITPVMSPTMVAMMVPVPTSRTVGQMRSPTTWTTGGFSANESPNFRRTVSFQ